MPSFTFEEKQEIEMLVSKRQDEIATEQNAAAHSNQQLLDQEINLLLSIVEKLHENDPRGGRRRRNRKTRKGARKNRKD